MPAEDASRIWTRGAVRVSLQSMQWLHGPLLLPPSRSARRLRLPLLLQQRLHIQQLRRWMPAPLQLLRSVVGAIRRGASGRAGEVPVTAGSVHAQRTAAAEHHPARPSSWYTPSCAVRWPGCSLLPRPAFRVPMPPQPVPTCSAAVACRSMASSAESSLRPLCTSIARFRAAASSLRCAGISM